jgi:sec-independent protein translocase protein TatC
MAQKDLFDDSTMSFGEHLEVLRVHLWKAIIGLVIGSTAAFFFSNHIIVAIQTPVVTVMEEKFGRGTIEQIQATADKRSAWEIAKEWYRLKFGTPTEEDLAKRNAPPPRDPAMFLTLDAREIARKLHGVAPKDYALPPEDAKPAVLEIALADTPFGKMIGEMRKESLKPRTDGVEEAFMIYLKVSLVVGLLLSSPWIFYQIWLFVAAGLYPNERKYVYSYLPFSIGLFLGGAFFCFYVVIPQVLGFLFDFNIWLGMRPEVKISTWISFVLVVSLMFGVSFQLPMVMLLLERISIVSVNLYRTKRRFAILIIAILSMVLTPSDPVSMMMMMIPLCILYEVGILICGRGIESKSPFGTESA